MKEIVLIVAGGSGTRMKSDTPKQFLTIQGKPLLFHTIDRFIKYKTNIEVRLVLPETQIETWNELCKKFKFDLKINLFKGGSTRYHSVKNGLSDVQKESLVAIHDGVRPFVAIETIERCFKKAERMGTAVPVMPLKESLRKISNEVSVAEERSMYRTVQTPQVFKANLLMKAYEQEFENNFTDDASIVEKMGTKIHLVNGNEENIKITSPMDLLIAQELIKL